jgi:hypothetical protein
VASKDQLRRTIMRFTGFALILALGSTTALAQEVIVGPDSIYALSYFSNAHVTGAPDAALRLVNDGFVSDASPVGDLCASIYVFDSSEEMNECCSCRVTPNGILSLSVNTNLTSNTLTQVSPKRGVIKVVSSYPFNINGIAKVGPSSPISGACDPTVVNPELGIKGWLTHVQKGTGTGFGQTEEELTDSTLGQLEEFDLAEDCKVLGELGSGRGICTCTDSLQ